MKTARTVRPGGRWKRTHPTGHLASGLPELLHARSGFTVTLTVQPAVIRISVRDDSPLPAAGPRPALQVAPTHGLGAVAALAARWGADPTGEGKEVWAELSR